VLEAIRAEVTELERLCARGEQLFMKRDWTAFDQTMLDQRRVTHGIAVQMSEAASLRTPEFDEEVAKRLRIVLNFREDQLKRLSQYRGKISERLGVLGRWKQMARSLEKKRGVSQLGSLDKLR
jgi:hypothetical protein